MTWKDAARTANKDYGSTLNWKEGYFICPECMEPIYEDDYSDFDECPICGFVFDEE